MKPAFLVIGGMKCGTSALYSYLSQQEGIYMPPKKNIEFFCDDYWPKGTVWYESFFPREQPGTKIVGEISSEYTKFPHRCNVPERIAKVLPDIRLIYLVRHPIKRMISHYIHNVSNLSENRPLEIALYPDEVNHYVNLSLYYMQIEQYLPYFSREKIKIIRSEDLLERPQEMIKSILDFVGANRISPVEKEVVHTRKEKRSWNSIGRVIRRSPKLFDLFNYYQKRMPSIISSMALRAVSSPMYINKLPRDLHNTVIDYIQADVSRLYCFSGNDLAKWDLEKI